MERPIIEIDEEKCNGCGQCILDCAEGALAIVNGKAKLISEVYCDGLGACLNCPQGALSLSMREAPPFDEAAAFEAKQAREKAAAGNRPALKPLGVTLRQAIKTEEKLERSLASALHAWPLQLMLMPPRASFLQGADMLLAAQCSGFALPHIHDDWLKGRVPVIACPKLESKKALVDKLAQIIRENDLAHVTVLRMSVPCCDMETITREAMLQAGRDVPWSVHVVKMR